jgi:hypothetical protein
MDAGRRVTYRTHLCAQRTSKRPRKKNRKQEAEKMLS